MMMTMAIQNNEVADDGDHNHDHDNALDYISNNMTLTMTKSFVDENDNDDLASF